MRKVSAPSLLIAIVSSPDSRRSKGNQMSTTTITTPNNTPGALMRFEAWLKTVPASTTTGWRWRREGKIKTLNVSGRQYVTAAAVQEFISRAEAGEFAEEHITPTRTGRGSRKTRRDNKEG